MPRWKKPSREEIRELRRALAAKAAAGELRLPEAVAEIRYSFGMTQDQFAQATGLTKRQVAEIETGKANPTLETLDRIGRLFGFTVGLVPRQERTGGP
jgi:DNA-binding XRE family transcriptional regulator